MPLRLASMTIKPHHAQAHASRSTKSGDPGRWVRRTLAMHGLEGAAVAFVETVDGDGGFWGYYWRAGGHVPAAMPGYIHDAYLAYLCQQAGAERSRLGAGDMH